MLGVRGKQAERSFAAAWDKKRWLGAVLRDSHRLIGRGAHPFSMSLVALRSSKVRVAEASAEPAHTILSVLGLGLASSQTFENRSSCSGWRPGVRLNLNWPHNPRGTGR